jgi:succinoglycan biosynthesis transport protein ExoP
MALKDLVQAFRTGWWLVVIGVLLFGAGAGVLALRSTPLYSSSTQLFVSTTGTEDTSTAYQGNLLSQQRVTSYVELLSGNQLAQRVIDVLGLQESPARLRAGISAGAVPDTVLLNVTVTRSSPEEARDIARAVGEEFATMVATLETPDRGASSPVKVTVTDAPQVSASPVSPQPARTVSLGAFLGLILGLGAAVFRERLDNTVKSPADVTNLTGIAVVGAFIECEGVAEGNLVDDNDAYSETAEAYRQLRTSLQFVDVDDPARTIVVTSSLPGEGKTTVAVNLALVLAQSGARVTLIEADLRRPRVTRTLGMVSGAGLSNVLAGEATFEQLVQPYQDGRLAVLAAGPVPPYPSEMLGSKQMHILLEQAARCSDYVIIDAPPLLPVTDAAVLSVAADAALIVARHGVTTRAQLTQAVSHLQRIEAKILGVVLNRIPAKAASGYGYGYSYSYHSPVGGEDADRGTSNRRPMIDHTTEIPVVRLDEVGRSARWPTAARR